jgi:hypothetical protein
MSAKHKCNFTVEQVKDGEYCVTKLSVSSENQVLLGQKQNHQLLV